MLAQIALFALGSLGDLHPYTRAAVETIPASVRRSFEISLDSEVPMY
jgi:hypothetical protein